MKKIVTLIFIFLVLTFSNSYSTIQLNVQNSNTNNTRESISQVNKEKITNYRKFSFPIKIQALGGLAFMGGVQYNISPSFSISALIGALYYWKIEGIEDNFSPTSEFYVSYAFHRYNFQNLKRYNAYGIGLGAQIWIGEWPVISPMIRYEVTVDPMFFNFGIKIHSGFKFLSFLADIGVKF